MIEANLKLLETARNNLKVIDGILASNEGTADILSESDSQLHHGHDKR